MSVADVDPRLPPGFRAGHWTDPEGATGCTVVLPPPTGTMASGEVRGGGPGTRETDLLSPLANAREFHGVLLTGGSAFGLAAAGGVVDWLEQQGIGYRTPAGIVPLVPAAVVYDLASGDAAARPGPDQGRAACEAATGRVERGSVGAGSGAAVGKVLGREQSVKAGVGLASQALPAGPVLSALAVANAFGDVLGEHGEVLAGAWREGEGYIGTTELLRSQPFELPPSERDQPEGNTVLVCIATDAELSKTDCAIVAKMAHAGVARAVDPVNTAVDGDVAFCLASGTAGPAHSLVTGVVAAALAAEAIRDAVRQATALAGIPTAAQLAERFGEPQ